MDSVRELLRQVWEGDDFASPTELLSKIPAATAVRIPASAPYPIATNVAHADIWQRLWLANLKGERKFNPFPDFREVAARDWDCLRAAFLANFAMAIELAYSEPFIHHSRTDIAARKLLTKIAVHNAYHLGQVALLKRILRSQRRASSSD